MRHFLSFLIIAVFFLFAVASKTNKMTTGAFHTYASPEKGRESYVELLDGTRIHGSRIAEQSGMLVRDVVKLDGEKFKSKETKGYMDRGVYYVRFGNVFIKRIIHGKINIYYHERVQAGMDYT